MELDNLLKENAYVSCKDNKIIFWIIQYNEIEYFPDNFP